MSEEARKERLTLSVVGITDMLHNGVTRRKRDKGYDPEIGSIEEKFEMTDAEVTRLFKNPLLANIRWRPKIEDRWDLIDDRPETLAAQAEAQVEEMGQPTADTPVEDTSEDNADQTDEVPVSNPAIVDANTAEAMSIAPVDEAESATENEVEF